MTAKLPDTAYTQQPWRVHELTRDFRLEDVWALDTPGGPGDLDRLVRQVAGPDGGDGGVKPALGYRLLMSVRERLGALLGLDKKESGVGERVNSLRDRLPDDLRSGRRGPDIDGTPLTSVYQTDREWVAEFANTTAHAVLHLAWLPDGAGRYHGQMAVLVKPNGPLGRLYIRFIDPFRRWVVVPALVKKIGKEWALPAG